MTHKKQKIAIGCDEAAFELKHILIEYLKGQHKIEVEDFGCYDTSPVLYPDVAKEVAQRISKGEFERGILLCGTGIGMCIVANKVKGIRAACCHDAFSAQRARKSNDAQIITMGARVIGHEHAKVILDAWLQSNFVGGGSAPKVDLINEIDAERW
ncbi:MAG: ribose 5-phosphate isomerase B [Alphaproteobacteria bacterium]